MFRKDIIVIFRCCIAKILDILAEQISRMTSLWRGNHIKDQDAHQVGPN